MEILMVLTNIITISLILFPLILVSYVIKRAYHRRRCIKLLEDYRNSCEDYNKAYLEVQAIISDNKADPEERKTLPSNLISLKEYKERRL